MRDSWGNRIVDAGMLVIFLCFVTLIVVGTIKVSFAWWTP